MQTVPKYQQTMQVLHKLKLQANCLKMGQKKIYAPCIKPRDIQMTHSCIALCDVRGQWLLGWRLLALEIILSK